MEHFKKSSTVFNACMGRGFPSRVLCIIQVMSRVKMRCIRRYFSLEKETYQRNLFNKAKLNSLSQRFANHRTQNSVKQSAFMCDDVGLRGLRPHLEQEKIGQAYTFLGLVLAETNPAGILENCFYLLRISKCTANAKILFPVYFLDTSLTLTLFVLWVSQAGLCCFTD